MFNINDDHMIYGSWDMERNVQNFFFFHSGLSFIVLTPTHPPPRPPLSPSPLTTQKMKVLIIKKKHLHQKLWSHDVLI